MGPMWDMCHHLRGRKSKDVDKVQSKRANERVTCGKRGQSYLNGLTKSDGRKRMGGEKEREGKREKKKEEKEALPSL